MKIFTANIPITLGDSICIKSHLDAIKDNFEQIILNFNLIDVKLYKNNDVKYYHFLNDLGNLLFSKSPYIYDANLQAPFRAQENILTDNGFKPQLPRQKELLCKGNSLQLEQEYIVITTKIRYLLKSEYNSFKSILFEILNKLSNKYKIVILGEREVEMLEEYKFQLNEIYGIYNDLINNLSNTLDLTIPALGITAPNLSQIQQDCLIMNEAKFVITLGIGGNFCMALGSESNVIGYRNDNEPISEALFNGTEYPKTFITKDFNKFIKKLTNYC